MNPDRLAELEDERRFLLRSLTDLEREFEAGDVDRRDFEVLRDGYVARAADVLRSIDGGRAVLPPRRKAKPRVVVATILGVVALAVLCGWLVARSSGQRLSGETMTGGQEVDDVDALLVQARSHFVAGDFQASAATYVRAAELDPANSEARTYTSWLLVLDARNKATDTAEPMLAAAFGGFEQVIADDPTYADAHCLYAVALHLSSPTPDTALIAEQRELCEGNDPPSEMLGLVNEQLGPP